jgi:hypothetical protein
VSFFWLIAFLPKPSNASSEVRPRTKQTARKSASNNYVYPFFTPSPPSTHEKKRKSPDFDLMDVDDPDLLPEPPKKKSRGTQQSSSSSSSAPALKVAGHWIVQLQDAEAFGFPGPFYLQVRRSRAKEFHAKFFLGKLRGVLKPVPDREVTVERSHDRSSVVMTSKFQWRGRDGDTNEIQLDTGTNRGWIRFSSKDLAEPHIAQTLKGEIWRESEGSDILIEFEGARVDDEREPTFNFGTEWDSLGFQRWKQESEE